ncbi:YheC/YheD family protein [Halalkalibacter flavus]|uniref:YheC/YheD family endospore coat-associated protein n=1 Tax=Halalkalibacter flavus TaxID=3090668 RepID=UPI002FC5C171
MGNLPLIGIMVPNQRQRNNILNMYQRYKGELRIELFSFTPKDINWRKRTIRGVCLKNNTCETEIFRFPDAVYNRCYRKKKKTIRKLEKYIGKNKCFNAITYFNKWRIYKILSSNNLGKLLPSTSLYHPDLLAEQLTTNKRLILKPSYGSLGRHIYLIESTKDNIIKVYQDSLTPRYMFDDINLLLETITDLIGKKNYILQKEIKLAKVRGKMVDLRILIQKDRHGRWGFTKGISRVAPYNFFITNVSERIYEMDETLEMLVSDPLKRNAMIQEIQETCIKVSQILEEKIGLLGEIGIDMALDENGRIWIIEVNGKTQKFIYHMVNGSDCKEIDLIYKRPLEYASYLSQT